MSRELIPATDTERWASGEATAAILADIFDAIRAFDSDVMHKGTRRRPKQIQPDPRPWAKEKGSMHIGKDPLPISEFEKWWNTTPTEGGGANG